MTVFDGEGFWLTQFGGNRGLESSYILIMRCNSNTAASCRQVFIEPKFKHLKNDEA